MKPHAKVKKDLEDLISQLNDYIDKNITLPKAMTSGTSFLDLSNTDVVEHVPALNDLDIEIARAGLHTVFEEALHYVYQPHICIPIRNFTDIELVTWKIEDNSYPAVADSGWQYYDINTASVIEQIPLQKNFMYFVNGNVKTSYRYTNGKPTDPKEFGVMLVIGTHQNIFNYFE